MNNTQRHPTNILFRQVVDQVGPELLRGAHYDLTGKQISTETIRRYYNGYGTRPLPETAYLAASAIVESTFIMARAALQLGRTYDPKFIDKATAKYQELVDVKTNG